jgi:hypothetical protein
VLVLALIWLALSALLFAGTQWFQGYIYSEPADELYWRTPAAAAALTLFLGLWCFLDYRAGDPASPVPFYDTLFRFSTKEDKPLPQIRSVTAGKETLYEWRDTEYRSREGKPWSRGSAAGIVEAIILTENDQDVIYKVELTPDGRFKSDPVRYLEEGGKHRVLTEADLRLGKVTTARTGRFLMNIFLNGLYLALWFVCAWLLLRFQWPHALGLAALFWLGMTLLIVPLVLDQTQAALRERGRTNATTAS